MAKLVAAELPAERGGLLTPTRLPAVTSVAWQTPVELPSALPVEAPAATLCQLDEGDFLPGERWFESASLFLGLDGSKQPQDFGVNANFGGRFAVNLGVPLLPEWGLGAQLGTAYDATADAVQVADRIGVGTGRTQSFTSFGLFQRTESGINWGVVYDYLAENSYDRFTLGQWRINLAYEINTCNTIGVWSAIGNRGANGIYTVAPNTEIPVTLLPITQTNAYVMHEWAGGSQTTFWGGLANQHGQVNVVLGDLPPIETPFVFGADIYIPLTNRIALFGQGNFIMPADSGTVDSYLGFEFYPYGGARTVRRSPFAPLQSVAAPTNFAVDLRR